MATAATLAREPRRQGLRVVGLSHRYGPRRVIERIDLDVPPGEVHCLVGPSGCGKTTILRLIAGLEPLQEGEIAIGGRLVARPGFAVPPERRRVGLMFQDFALFPHLSVAENVAFGLADRPRPERAARVRDLLRRVGMERFAEVYPHTLSGGEQQRVALARALAPSPDLMLLDEAFSALDTTLRAQIREETIAILKETGTPTLLVTHDAEEAVRVGDRIHAMEGGRIVQSGTAAELYARPADLFVAGFFGPVNRFRARVADGTAATPLGAVPAPGHAPGSAVEVVVRPEGLELARARPQAAVRAIVVERRDLGPLHLLQLRLADGTLVKVRKLQPLAIAPGEEVEVRLDPAHVFVYPSAGEG
ncbi:MAG: ABC transporter ATP-binding protein [Geminicoccaceae bacterium]|nr:ABC transporter ATP-binding protein [Geminicoccaceae bacterium]MCS7268395.1 ABC transporter ATP-binding protein [Geminicoccaceae bacterium]MDW8124288.1 ABC transporter ATP-binding protein [Geminicoccaceae bacterium]MDW8342199.1 ABC transporter ATP-binding protein [Geminicoccaceae bacterium]